MHWKFLLKKESGKIFTLTKYFDDKSIYTQGHFFDDGKNGKKRLNFPHERSSVKLYKKLRMTNTPKQHQLDSKCLDFEEVMQKLLYEEAPTKICFD